MMKKLHSGLFSPDPRVRLEAVAGLSKPSRDKLLEHYSEWIPNAYGAANAWAVIVGPSPGRARVGSRKKRATGIYQPVLGEVHPKIKEGVEEWPFWRELLRWVREAFCESGVLQADLDLCQTLILMMNLDIACQGQESRISQPKLRKGLDRLWFVVDSTKPRMLIALTKRVYNVILAGLESDGLGWKVYERKHKVKAGREYHPKSCWIVYRSIGPILLVVLPQHPSRANTYKRHRRRFDGFLGERVREATRGTA